MMAPEPPAKTTEPPSKNDRQSVPGKAPRRRNRKGRGSIARRKLREESRVACMNNLIEAKVTSLGDKGTSTSTLMKPPATSMGLARQSSVGVNTTFSSASVRGGGQRTTAPNRSSNRNVVRPISANRPINTNRPINASSGGGDRRGGGSGESRSIPQEKQRANDDRPKDSSTSGEILKPFKVDTDSVLNSNILSLIGSRDYWHKFIVIDGAVHERTQVLKSVLQATYPWEFIPVLYRIEGPHSTFLARGCTSAIVKLFHTKLTVMMDGFGAPNQKVALEIILCFAHINALGLSVHDSLTGCIRKRYDISTKTLNLSDFANDPDLVDLFYCPLWLSRVFSFVLLRAKAHKKPIVHMYMNKNELSTIRVLNVWEELKSLQTMDLSENKLDNVYSLAALQPIKLTELNLDKNPLCARYSSGEGYVRQVRLILPTLKKLDGVFLCDPDIPYWHRNFVISKEGTDFVDQFLQHYFTIFDSDSRQCLQGMYHEEACFSMSANYLPGQSTSSTARLTRYTMESRNLLKISDYTKSYSLISHGPVDVIAALCRLPRTEHDPFSFAVDLVHYSETYVVLTVSGVYREPSMMNQAMVRFFNRTFVLVMVGNLQFQICNEILLISNATTSQDKYSFRFSRSPANLTQMALTAFEEKTNVDRSKMTQCLAELTEMKPRWARKCLEESKWKFREALQVFTELLKMDKIPAEAFTLPKSAKG